MPHNPNHHDINTCTINHGVIIERQRVDDYVRGFLPFVNENPSGAWQQYQRNYEVQWTPGTDYANCVTQSISNAFVMGATEKIVNKKIPTAHLQWLKMKGYINEKGDLNISEKYNSILNGTTQQGNSYGVVFDHLRVDGIIPESMLPSHIGEDWNTYYNRADITDEMIELGKESLKYIDIRHQWVGSNAEFPTAQEIQQDLKHAPIIGIIPGHSLGNVQQFDPKWIYFNSYEPFNGERVGTPKWAKKIVVNFIGNPDIGNMTREQVIRQYVLMRHVMPSEGEIAHWTGRSLDDFQITMMKDDAQLLLVNAN